MSNSNLQPADEERTVYVRLTLAIQVLLIVAVAFFIYLRNWENVFRTSIVIGLTLVPAFVGRRYRVIIPPVAYKHSAA